MEIFLAERLSDSMMQLSPEESQHCVRVMRHPAGSEIDVVDGIGNMYHCRLVSDSVKGAQAEILETFPGWGGHPYRLTMAVCPTKNNDRYEWFAEKAVEAGVDDIVPVIGEHSERKVFKKERLGKIVTAAAKQSLKAAFPSIADPVSVKDFIVSQKGTKALKLIAYCFEDGETRTSIEDALKGFAGDEYVIMIGPEGDFSKEEASLAIANGFIPIHIGKSRLRTETAGVAAVMAVYLKYV